jgi:primosomal protein N' (replication factor Y)
VRDELVLPPSAVLGPAPLFRLRGRDRAQLIVKAKPENRARAIDIVGGAVDRVASSRVHKHAALSVDVDPQ